jgi:hypothetical protein
MQMQMQMQDADARRATRHVNEEARQDKVKGRGKKKLFSQVGSAS